MQHEKEIVVGSIGWFHDADNASDHCICALGDGTGDDAEAPENAKFKVEYYDEAGESVKHTRYFDNKNNDDYPEDSRDHYWDPVALMSVEGDTKASKAVITLLADIELEDTTILVDQGKNLTIQSDSAAEDPYTITLTQTGTIAPNEGGSNAPGMDAISITKDSTLTLNNVKVDIGVPEEGAGENATQGIYNDGTLNLGQDATVTIDGVSQNGINGSGALDIENAELTVQNVAGTAVKAGATNISHSTVSATGTGAHGISVTDLTVTGDAAVTVDGAAYYGVRASGDVSMSGANTKVTVTNSSNGTIEGEEGEPTTFSEIVLGSDSTSTISLTGTISGEDIQVLGNGKTTVDGAAITGSVTNAGTGAMTIANTTVAGKVTGREGSQTIVRNSTVDELDTTGTVQYESSQIAPSEEGGEPQAIYSAQEAVNAWTTYIEESQLGSTVVPGSEMVYSEVPDIAAALSAGYSALWNANEQEIDTTDHWSAVLQEQEDNLLKTVKDYNLFLLDTIYNDGNGYEVGGTTYKLSEQVYQQTKAIIENATSTVDVMGAYSSSADSQYSENEVAIDYVGFEADAEAANAAINAAVEALDGTSGTVSDCDVNTVFVKLTKRSGTEAYNLVMKNSAGTGIYTQDIKANDDYGVVYFTFEQDGGSHTTAPIAADTYTVSLMKDGWSDPINSVSITLSELSFNTDEGSEAPDSYYAAAGSSVTLPTAPTKTGFTFQGWSDGSQTYNAGATYVVPTQSTTLTAQWGTESDLPTIDEGGSSGGSGSTTYAVSVNTAANGTVSVSPRNASKGATVTITVTPNEGYVLGTLTATDANGDTISLTNAGNGKYTFTMPSSKVTISATFVVEGEQKLPFTDVATGEWYYEAVQYVYDNELMNGMSATTFEPNSTTTRGMIVTMLYRLENEPAAASAGFTDVAAGQWYTDAVNWAAANNIVNGYGDSQFGPTDTITREQMAAILYRYAQYKGYDVTASADLSTYTDAASVSSYAVSAMQWAVGEGLINGITDTTLVPGGSATRAQVAAILMRFCENVAK